MITMCRAGLLFGVCLFCGLTTAQSSGEAFEASVQNPARSFGYTIGDTLEQIVFLQNGGATIRLAELPLEQREGRWVLRSKVTLNPDGTALILLYQVINAPPDVRVISLPELILHAEENVEMSVPSWEFTLAPLITTSAERTVPLMQADFIPSAPDSNAARENLRKLVAALVTTLFFWLSWWLWRNWRESQSLPFALAYHKVRHARKDQPLKRDSDCWLALHQAFNRCAGKSIAEGSVPELLANVRWLKPLEDDINTFFRISSARFFSTRPVQQTFNLNDFAKHLYVAEKRNNNRHYNQSHIDELAP